VIGLRTFRGVIVAALCLLLSGGEALAATGSGASGTPFERGKKRLSVSGGYGGWDDNAYLVLGLGAGYFLADGLEAGLDANAWLGDKPHMYTLSPSMRYVFYQWPQFNPFVGAYYKRAMYDTLSPLDAIGGRAGITSPISERTYLSAGVAYEHYFDCDLGPYSTCSQLYPEISISFTY
jgi:hypothetical protein